MGLPWGALLEYPVEGSFSLGVSGALTVPSVPSRVQRALQPQPAGHCSPAKAPFWATCSRDVGRAGESVHPAAATSCVRSSKALPIGHSPGAWLPGHLLLAWSLASDPPLCLGFPVCNP